MVMESFTRLFSIDMPVPNAIEATCVYCRIVECLCKKKCLAKPGFSLRIIASSPQETEINQALPHDHVLIIALGVFQSVLVITACMLKLAEDIIGTTPQA